VRLQDQILQAVQAEVEAVAPVAGNATVRIEPTRNSEAEPEPITVDVRGAGRMLGLSRTSVLALADRGKLTKLRFGRRVVYDVGEITALVEQRRRSASQAERRGRAARLHRLAPGDQAD
jgi:hypothetical protein